ncbi:TPA: hypothetical protein QH074_004311 [Enterobacter hormaechei subsp. steigerwaltii]|nr:hypothetical protein [Enterobacter hormaechei subsp. steigerwaltii]
MTPEQRHRTARIADILAWGLLAWVPINAVNAWVQWHNHDLTFSALSVTCALMCSWNSRKFVRFKLLQLALWYARREILRMFNQDIGDMTIRIPIRSEEENGDK